MKRLTLLLILLGTAAFGQGKFVTGYFINKDGKRTDCQINLKSESSRDNPKSFDYRAADGAETQTGDLNAVTEVGLNSGTVFRIVTVEMDRSPDDLDRISQNEQTSQLRSPVFASETLFLRLIVSGKATLYQYDEGRLHRFFFSVSDNPIKQLVYKRYLVKNTDVNIINQKYGDLSVGVNEDYKQVLLNELGCSKLKASDFENLSYNAGKLKSIFNKYNKCQ